MTLSTATANTWSSDVASISYDTVVQCRSGAVFVSWAAVAPANTADGFLLMPGESVVIPSGNAWRYSGGNSGGTLYHSGFVA